ncbi:MAG: tRNA dihydrouridine synthase DusB [Clostridia bacterium]|nr:tRNA dihydrouridine synthase DusB [Clostridia bacterium]
MRIGGVDLQPGASLAPMAGVTDLPFRLLAREQGSAFSVTEMISAKGFLYAPENKRALQTLLARGAQEGPVALQLFGSEPEVMAAAAERLAARGFFAIDINFGCPAPKITGGGAGCALMRDLPLCARIIAAVRRATALPLTVKMRAGWDDTSITCVKLAQIAEAEGANAVVVHGRTRRQQYAGEADWSHVARVKASVSVPVIGNGDVTSAEKAIQRMHETGCDGVMIGRGALGNPWIFAQVRAALRGQEPVQITPDEKIHTILRHARMLTAWKGERVAMREMRKHAAWYTRGFKDATKIRAAVQRVATLEELEGTLRVKSGS